MIRPPSAGSILYIVSRFPKITETFVLNEWLALSKRFRLELAALLRSRQARVHPAASQVLPRVWFASLSSAATLLAQVSWLLHRPRRYLGVLVQVLRGSRPRSTGGWLKAAIVFLKGASIAKRASAEHVEHVHAHFANHPATAAWIVHRLAGTSFSFTAHANDLFVGPALLEEKVRDAAFVVAVSEYNRRYLLQRCPSGGRLEVIHCGVDPTRFKGGTTKPSRRHRLICVASLVTKKGHAYLLQAFAILSAEFPDLELALVGDGPERTRIARLAQHLGIGSRVLMLGDLSMEDVRTELARSHIFVLASVRLASGRAEGIPVALMEAMATGIPVVATDVSGVSELVIDEVTGLLVPQREPRVQADAIRRLIEDEALAGRLVADARDHVIRHFNLEVEAHRLGDLFESLT